MKEYTLLTALFVLVTLGLDRRLGTRLLGRPVFYLFLGTIMAIKLVVNGALTCQGIVRYNPSFFLGIRLGCIPLEDFLFGFSMVTQTIIFWEFFKRRERRP